VPSLRRKRSPCAAGGSIPSASHHAGVAGRSSLGAPLRRRGFDYRHPHQPSRQAARLGKPSSVREGCRVAARRAKTGRSLGKL